jgi:TolB-like protein
MRVTSRRSQALAALPVLLVLTALAVFTATPLQAQDEDRSVVGVLRYDNNSGDEQYDHLGRAFSSMMISDLSVIERLQLIERERLEEIMDELDLQQSGYVDEESAQSLGMIVGAEYLVLGAFITVDPEIRMNTRVTRVGTTEIVTTAEVTGEQESLFDLQQRLADQIIEGLELALTDEERRLLSERQQENRIDDLETLVGYSQALCLMDDGSYVEALDAIQDVQRSAPGSQLVSATLSLLTERAVASGRNQLTDRVSRRVGGLLGRRAPEPALRTSAC